MSVKPIQNLEDLRSLAQELQSQTFLRLTGPMGSGKTQLTQFIVEALGGEETSSPSFSIINTYPTKSFDVHHVDLYRLEDEDDIESTGFWDLFTDENAIVIIEWADRIQSSEWPEHWRQITVDLKVNEDHSRTISIL